MHLHVKSPNCFLAKFYKPFKTSGHYHSSPSKPGTLCDGELALAYSFGLVGSFDHFFNCESLFTRNIPDPWAG